MALIQSIEKNLTYAEKTFSTLKRMIMLGDLPSGTVINEREISEQLGISRTPLRDALQLLEEKGWVVKSGKSRYITEIDMTGLKSDIQIRRALEILSADLVLKELTPEHFDHFAHLMSIMESNDIDYVGFLEADQRFHTYLGKISGNAKLYRILDDACEQLIRYSINNLRTNSFRREVVQNDHRKMYELLRKQDLDQYKIAVEKHLRPYWGEKSGL